ncbi:MAG TPA: 4-hydroxybutyrate dehydrogenase [Clostridiaceae bacterium]|nr:4-hydroxybutyrate dehydrogenase [Clostridiaceae bacterium]
MKSFSIRPIIQEFETFKEFADYANLGKADLILTNEFIYDPFIKPTGVPCPALFQEKYGVGEPTDVMIDAIRADFPTGIERVIAVGGGTVVDIAKVLILDHEGNTEDVFMGRNEANKVRELIAVPTTCGTGSEVTNVAVTALTGLNTKRGLALDIMYPDFAVLIPEMIKTLPYRFFATSSVDAMVHSVESYLSPKASDYSKMFAEKAIDIIIRRYRQIVDEGLETWVDHGADFLRASNYGGITFGNAGCAAVHALSYPLSGKYHIAHGEANLLMFEAVIRKYLELDSGGRIQELEALLAASFDQDSTEGIWDTFFDLLNAVFQRKPLAEYGVQADELADFADGVIAGQQRLLQNNYIELGKDDMIAIYQSCLNE